MPRKSPVCLPPSRTARPARARSEEQWVAKTKVTCAKWRPARRPASHLAPTLGTSVPLPRAPGPRAEKANPQVLAPGPGQEPSAPLQGPGSHRGHSPAENWPRADPSSGPGERSKNATKAGSAAAAVSMSTLGEVSSSFAKSCPGDRSEIHDRGAGRASRGASGASPAARRHFSRLRGRQTTSGAPRSLASPVGRGGSSPWLGGGCSC